MGNEIETTRSVMGDENEMRRLAAPMSFGSRTRTMASMSFGSRTRTRMTVSMSFESRTRSVLGGSVLGGDDLDGGASAGVRSRWWCDLGWMILATRSRRRVGGWGTI